MLRSSSRLLCGRLNRGSLEEWHPWALSALGSCVWQSRGIAEAALLSDDELGPGVIQPRPFLRDSRQDTTSLPGLYRGKIVFLVVQAKPSGLYLRCLHLHLYTYSVWIVLGSPLADHASNGRGVLFFRQIAMLYCLPHRDTVGKLLAWHFCGERGPKIPTQMAAMVPSFRSLSILSQLPGTVTVVGVFVMISMAYWSQEDRCNWRQSGHDPSLGPVWCSDANNSDLDRRVRGMPMPFLECMTCK